jgi:putative mRNA 3-end processing factor
LQGCRIHKHSILRIFGTIDGIEFAEKAISPNVRISMISPILSMTDAGLYCSAGDFHIDPWNGVPRAVITHAHGDHLRWGSQHYLVSKAGENVSRVRLAPEASIQSVEYGETLSMNRAKVSFYPAGHVLGSAQIRIEVSGEIWVVSGDYKTGGGDPTCLPFEPVTCHGFVTESTFGLPIYHWKPSAELYADINTWWRSNATAGKASVVFAYSLGKAQRVLAGLDAGIGPIYTHGAVERLTQAYRESGVSLPPTEYAGVAEPKAKKKQYAGAMVLAPPSADGSPWLKKFAPLSEGVASGWMAIRGTRRRKSVDRGFVMSDHADWNGLHWAIKETGAEKVWVTHGYTAVMVRHLREQGLDAEVLYTRFEGEGGSEAAMEAPT